MFCCTSNLNSRTQMENGSLPKPKSRNFHLDVRTIVAVGEAFYIDANRQNLVGSQFIAPSGNYHQRSFPHDLVLMIDDGGTYLESVDRAARKVAHRRMKRHH